MNKASLSFLVFVFASLLLSIESFAQNLPGQVISERVQQNLRRGQRLRLSELLPLERHQQIQSLTLLAEGPLAQSSLQLLQRNRVLAEATVKKQLREVRLGPISPISIEDLELSSLSEIYIESISVEVASTRPQREQQVSPQSLITLQVNRRVSGLTRIPLDQLVRQQHHLTLAGAQIERVVVTGQGPSVQVELNHRPVGPVKYLRSIQNQTPLPLNSMEEVRALSLLVKGSGEVTQVRIRVGNVRPQNRPERVRVGQEVSPRYPLDLSRLIGNDRRLVSALLLEARALNRSQSQLVVTGLRGEVQGSAIINSSSSRVRIQLKRPASVSELRLESLESILVDSLELEADSFQVF